jgi:hypothetical protein
MCRRSDQGGYEKNLEAIDWSNSMHVGPKEKRKKLA